MNPTEIYDALSEIAAKPFNAVEFPFEFARATDAAEAAIVKLRNGTTNKSDLPSGVLFNKKFHYAPALGGLVDVTLDQLKVSKKNVSAKPAILIATDGETIAALHPASDTPLHCTFAELGDNFGFFLPAAGKERYKALEENPVDIKATGKLARLYDALIKANPDWATDARRHDMNRLMMRLIFCLFAEDVGIFHEEQFSKLIFTHAGNKGEETREVLNAAFTAMNLPKNSRETLPAWTRELEYVNGGLFAGAIDTPCFDIVAFRYLREAASLNWREINPDIFGSMIQSVADPKMRSELGMHYTSVPNIMKVIGPLLFDDIDAEIAKACDRPKALHKLIDRLEHTRIFDPACGSGNFLVVAYRQLREREMRILKRLEELEGAESLRMFSAIAIKNFYGIEITDFGVETAKLALFIAEYQANTVFATLFGRTIAPLPLRDAANITHGNALRLDWEAVCPPPKQVEKVFIVGNPPWVWSNDQTQEQKADMRLVFQDWTKPFATLDYVSGWFVKAIRYSEATRSKFAFVTTNSITQGQSVSYLWAEILKGTQSIMLAHTTFKWSNSAAKNAMVDAVIIGIYHKEYYEKCRIYHENSIEYCNEISPYIIPNTSVVVSKASTSLFDLPRMEYGSKPIDGGHLILTYEEKTSLIEQGQGLEQFIRPLYGSEELIKDQPRYYFHIDNDQLIVAKTYPEIARRIESVRAARLASTDSGARSAADRPHQFREHRQSNAQSIFIPAVSSENRPYLTPILVGKNIGCTNRNFCLYDGPDWSIAIISSALHRIWVLTVCGKLQKRPNYSNTLGWNTFPVPKFSEDQLTALTASARNILKTRYGHYPKTIADLYDPDKMPEDLRAAHRENDELLETMYIGRPFRNDTERLEHLFKLYAAKIKSLKKVA